MRKAIQTPSAPAAIGNYSQAIKVDKTVYLSGQIPLDAVTMKLVEGDMQQQAITVFENMKQVAEAAGGSLKDIVKLTVFLVNLSELAMVNSVMQDYFTQPYPARTSIEVSALPKGASLEIDAVMMLAV
jgi:reactive intermediate/imine deaminase